jgi:acetoin utilization protein AcuB
MHKLPRLASVMTPFPHSVELDVNAQRALELMHEHAIRHLPVTRNHVVYSMVSRDAIARESDLSGRPPEGFGVADVCERDPYLVDLNTRLDEVLEMMAERQLHCVVATRGDRVAGVFTNVDVYRLLVAILRGESTPPDDVA